MSPGRSVDEITNSGIGCLATTEFRVMILPQCCFCINGKTSRTRRMTLIIVRFTPSSHESSVRRSNDSTGGPPALFTRIWIVPNCLTTALTNFLISFEMLTSARKGNTSALVASAISAAVCSRSFLLREDMTTVAPSRANDSAAALPSP